MRLSIPNQPHLYINITEIKKTIKKMEKSWNWFLQIRGKYSLKNVLELDFEILLLMNVLIQVLFNIGHRRKNMDTNSIQNDEKSEKKLG